MFLIRDFWFHSALSKSVNNLAIVLGAGHEDQCKPARHSFFTQTTQTNMDPYCSCKSLIMILSSMSLDLIHYI